MQHSDHRPCPLVALTDSEEADRFAKVTVKCSCGKCKEYFVGQVSGYVFVCNGLVILKYRKESYTPPPVVRAWF